MSEGTAKSIKEEPRTARLSWHGRPWRRLKWRARMTLEGTERLFRRLWGILTWTPFVWLEQRERSRIARQRRACDEALSQRSIARLHNPHIYHERTTRGIVCQGMPPNQKCQYIYRTPTAKGAVLTLGETCEEHKSDAERVASYALVKPRKLIAENEWAGKVMPKETLEWGARL